MVSRPAGGGLHRQKNRKGKTNQSGHKNKIFRGFISQARADSIKFKDVTSDNWFSSKEDMIDIKIKHKKDFVLPVKSNRTLAVSEQDRRECNFISIESLRLEAGYTSNVYLSGKPSLTPVNPIPHSSP